MSSTFSIEANTRVLQYEQSNYDYKIGLISLSTDLSVEQDFYAMRPDPGIGIFVNRVEFINPTTPENLYAMQPKISEAARLILPNIDLDTIVYACTSASAVIGDNIVRDSVNIGKPDTPVITPTTGAVAGFNTLEVDKITLMAPYLKSVSETLAGYFSDQGLHIQNLYYLDIEDDRDIASLCHRSIIEAAKSAVTSTTEGIFLSCTALPAVPIIDQLEAELGIPVVTSNQAMFWQALRKAGYAKPITGFGKLLKH